MSIQVIIVEDDSRLRSGLREIINSDPACECVGAFGSGEEALEKAPALKPQVAIMDINLPGMDGIECVRQLSSQLPELQIVMLTVYQDTNNLFRALAAGAHGYLVKPARARDLLTAIRDIHQGGAPMTSALARKVVDAFLNKRRSPPLQQPTSRLQHSPTKRKISPPEKRKFSTCWLKASPIKKSRISSMSPSQRFTPMCCGSTKSFTCDPKMPR